MLTVATLLWDANQHSFDWSRGYTEEWVVKLRAGFRRNLSMPFNFVCYVDHYRDMPDDIIQVNIFSAVPSVKDCIQPFELNEPMILVGLDTLVIRNIDHLAEYCLRGDSFTYPMLLPRDPFHTDGRACNGVCLVPRGYDFVWRHRSGHDDMTECRRWPHRLIDDVFPGSVKSYKGHVMGLIPGRPAHMNTPMGIDGVDIVYFHGRPKMAELLDKDFVRDHWRA